MTLIDINNKCEFMSSYPFLILSISVLLFCVIVPFILYYTYWTSKSKYKGGEGIMMNGKEISIPPISRAWRNLNVIIPVLSVGLLNIIVYSICIVGKTTLSLVLLGVILAILVFIFNGDDGIISRLHSFFAFMFFIYLLVMIYFMKDFYPSYYIWYWPYIPMGLCFLVMFIFNILQLINHENKSWPWYVSIAEYFFILIFFIHLLLLP